MRPKVRTDIRWRVRDVKGSRQGLLKKKRGARRHMKDEEENRSSAACADSRKIYFCERMNGE